MIKIRDIPLSLSLNYSKLTLNCKHISKKDDAGCLPISLNFSTASLLQSLRFSK